MAFIDYGALAWKNGKVLGKREDLFEEPIDTLGFDIEPFPEGMDGYVLVGNKDVVFSFYKECITICNIRTKKYESINLWCDFVHEYYNGLYYKKYITYRKKEYEIYGQKFTVKSLRGDRVALFEAVINGDKYEVIFGYGVDPKWWLRHIPEEYDYNKKMVNFLNSHDNKNYQLDKKYIKNMTRKDRKGSYRWN